MTLSQPRGPSPLQPPKEIDMNATPQHVSAAATAVTGAVG